MYIQMLFSTESGPEDGTLLQTLPALALGGLRYAGMGRRRGT